MSENPVGQAVMSSRPVKNIPYSHTAIRCARLLTFDPTYPEWPCADILVKNGVIQAIDADLSAHIDASTLVIEARGHLVMPGLINAHFHSPANFLKCMLDSLPLELFMLYEVPEAKDAAVNARAAYIRTLPGCAEMLKLGVTAVQDDAFFLPCPSNAEINAVISAYRDSGIRASVALDQTEVPELQKLPFLFDLVPPELKAKLLNPPPMSAKALLEYYRQFIQRWNGRLRAAVFCSAPQGVTPEYLRVMLGWCWTYLILAEIIASDSGLGFIIWNAQR